MQACELHNPKVILPFTNVSNLGTNCSHKSPNSSAQGRWGLTLMGELHCKLAGSSSTWNPHIRIKVAQKAVYLTELTKHSCRCLPVSGQAAHRDRSSQNHMIVSNGVSAYRELLRYRATGHGSYQLVSIPSELSKSSATKRCHVLNSVKQS